MVERILIVGFGSAGKRHFRAIQKILPNAKVALLSKSASINMLDDNPLVFKSIEEAKLFLPQVTVISNPAPLHASLGIEFAKTGSHLLIEKPLCVNASEAIELVETCNEQNKVLLPGYNLLFSDLLKTLKANLEDKLLGSPLSFNCVAAQFLPEWRPNADYRSGVSANRDLGGGVMLELSHEINYLLWLFGSVQFIEANIRNTIILDIDVDDVADLIFEFKKDNYKFPISGNLHIDFVRRDKTRFVEVVCERGTYKCDFVRGALDVFESDSSSWRTIISSPNSVAQSTHNMWSHFLSLIENQKGDPYLNGLALETLRVIEAAFRSSERKRGTIGW